MESKHLPSVVFYKDVQHAVHSESGISPKNLHKVRQNAKRKRTSVACTRCKGSKTRCSEYRPCSKCKIFGAADSCNDGDSVYRIPDMLSPGISTSTSTCPTVQLGDEVSSRISYGPSVYPLSSSNMHFAPLIPTMSDYQVSGPQSQLRRMMVPCQAMDEMIRRGQLSYLPYAQSIQSAPHQIFQAQRPQTTLHSQLLQTAWPSSSPLLVSNFSPHAAPALLGGAPPQPAPQLDALRRILALQIALAALTAAAPPAPP
jgi:hypothetical protein